MLLFTVKFRKLSSVKSSPKRKLAQLKAINNYTYLKFNVNPRVYKKYGSLPKDRSELCFNITKFIYIIVIT